MTRMFSDIAVATHIGWDVADVRDMRYQPGHQSTAVFSIHDGYYCAPANGKPPKGWNWERVGETNGRAVFFAGTEIVDD